MRIHYSLEASQVLNSQKFLEIDHLLQSAGVTDIWLMGYFFGKIISPIEDLSHARQILENKGYSTGIISIPVGHPGNSLNPDDNSVQLEIPPHWRYRIDSDGKKIHYCADIEPLMLQDNIDAIKSFLDAGFTRFFMDDDLRLGNWGKEIQGCFCENCIQEFNHKYSYNTSRIALKDEFNKGYRSSLVSAWISFNCEKISEFLYKIAQLGKNVENFLLGTMIMQYGDVRHGLDLASLLRIIPDLHIRIGECHFNDASFNSPKKRADEFVGMQLHLNYLNLQNAYSETTIFPPRALSPENWIFKAKMAVSLGIENLFLMGGTWFIEPNYWWKFGSHLSEIKSIQEKSSEEDLYYPIHIAMEDLSKNFAVPTNLLLLGIPAKPIKLDQVPNTQFTGNEILYIWQNLPLSNDWYSVIPKYQRLIITKAAYHLNSKFLSKMLVNMPCLIVNPGFSNLFLRRNIIKFCFPVLQFPVISKGRNVGLLWLKQSKTVILINFMDNPTRIQLQYKNFQKSVELSPLEVKIHVNH